MSRDGRSNPGRIVLKNQPRLHLADVLRRRRSTLATLVSQLGIMTYAALDIWCGRMGLVVPSETEFCAACPIARRVNSPLESAMVIEPHAVEPVADEPEHLPTSVLRRPRRSNKDDVA